MRRKKAYKGISLKILMTENKYHHGKIYTIRSHMTDKFYIGSTVNVLSKRMATHRGHYKAYKDSKYHNVSSFIILQYDDAKIELLETFKCETKNELEKREGELIREYRDSCVNMFIPCRTAKEYREDNNDKIVERRKKYYEDNQDNVLERSKKYYKDNKAKISEQQKTSINCICGSITSNTNKLRHERSQKHINFTSQINI